MAVVSIFYVLDVYVLVSGHVLGVKPRSLDQWWGIFTMPLAHGSLEHLFNNLTALFTCTALLMYFFPQKGITILGIMWLVSGAWTWALAAHGVHIGASALIYGLAAFLFLSGVLHKSKRLWGLTAFMICFYGGMVWGILPYKPGISWEGHLAGWMAGLILAVLLRKWPTIMVFYPEPVPSYELEEDKDEEDEDDEQWLQDQIRIMQQNNPRTKMRYVFKPRKKDDQKD